LKKSKAPAKKAVKSSKAKKTVSSKASKKTQQKMPVSTFDAWIAKQVRSGKREGPLEKSDESVALPKDTYEIWIEKQKPKEGTQQKEVSAAPDTYELWMSKQVAVKSTSGDSESAPAAPPTNVSTPN